MKLFIKKQLFSLLIILAVSVSCYKSVDVPEEDVIESSEFTQKLLIEDYTGTWCSNCTGAGHAIESAVDDNDRFIPVAIHYSAGTNGDPMHSDLSVSLVSAYNPSGSFPQVSLNRVASIWANDYLVTTLNDKLNKYAPVGLAINSSISDDKINLTVQVGFVEEATVVNGYKMVAYLLEDGLIYPQHNSSLPDLPEIIEDYEHNNVLRFSFTNVFGDELPNQVADNHRYSKDFNNIALPNNVENSANLKIVAFVLDANNNCLNIQVAHLGSDKDFD